MQEWSRPGQSGGSFSLKGDVGSRRALHDAGRSAPGGASGPQKVIAMRAQINRASSFFVIGIRYATPQGAAQP